MTFYEILKLLIKDKGPEVLLPTLERSRFDDMFEIDLNDGSYRNIFHVEDKYHVPALEGNFADFYLYTSAHTALIDDKERFL